MMIEISPSEADLSAKHTLAPLSGFQPDERMPRLSFSPQRNNGFDLPKTSVPEKFNRGLARVFCGGDPFEYDVNPSYCIV